jgi:hypothetical protein
MWIVRAALWFLVVIAFAPIHWDSGKPSLIGNAASAFRDRMQVGSERILQSGEEEASSVWPHWSASAFSKIKKTNWVMDGNEEGRSGHLSSPKRDNVLR